MVDAMEPEKDPSEVLRNFLASQSTNAEKKSFTTVQTLHHVNPHEMQQNAFMAHLQMQAPINANQPINVQPINVSTSLGMPANSFIWQGNHFLDPNQAGRPAQHQAQQPQQQQQQIVYAHPQAVVTTRPAELTTHAITNNDSEIQNSHLNMKVEQHSESESESDSEEDEDGKKDDDPDLKNDDDSQKPKKRKRTISDWKELGIDPKKLEDSVEQVKLRFEKGCECTDDNCFRSLNAAFVYKHRLNVAELTKQEHDMYMMGLQMACLSNPDETVRHRERKRQRCQYVFQGKRVCLDAFLYLENTTHYQMKRIRRHLMTHGVTPRIHGNQGRKPHNTFSLDIYQHATAFLHSYLNRNYKKYVRHDKQKKNKDSTIILPPDCTRKQIHMAYKEYCETFEPDIKVMGYSTFRQFMKKQFPHVKFYKVEGKPVPPEQRKPKKVKNDRLTEKINVPKGPEEERPENSKQEQYSVAQESYQQICLEDKVIPTETTTIWDITVGQ